jgi:hypothetical protein
MEISITVGENGLCSMESPACFSGLTAPAALERLKQFGINIVAPTHIDVLGNDTASKLSEKTAELEDVLSSGLADAVTGFRLRSSKWNSQLPEDRALLIAREIVDFTDEPSGDEGIAEEEEEKATEEEEKKTEGEGKKHNTKWHAVLAKAKHITEVPYTEDLEESDLKMKKNTAFHQHLLPMLLDIASSGVQGRTRNTSGFVGETVKYLLQKFRLLSVTL